MLHGFGRFPALRLLAVLAGLGCSGPQARPQAPAPAAKGPAAATKPQVAPPKEPARDRAAVVHFLNRFTFGPRPHDVEGVSQLGVEAWLTRQLSPSGVPDAATEAAIAPYRAAFAPPAELPGRFPNAGMDAERAELEQLPIAKRIQQQTDFKTLITYVQTAELVRHVTSERQVYEVLVDFWTNHFNVFAKKGLVKLFAADYVERVIRAHALGRFDELLLATARHPAMLIYLDNAQSTAKKGITENYARELLELHTLGADAGYTQSDVVDVARILTGWSVDRGSLDRLGFVFRKRAHDNGPKQVLGDAYPAGGGEQEGVDLLQRLARHPATARRLAGKLCQRFVADEPPAGCVARAAQAYLDSDTDVKAVLWAIIRGPEFWDGAQRRSKLKSGVEFMVSALRASGARLLPEARLVQDSAALGEAPLHQLVPTGYAETSAAWLSSTGALSRMNYAIALAYDKLPGIAVDSSGLFGSVAGAEQVARRAAEVLLGGQTSSDTVRVVTEQLRTVDDADDRIRLAVALTLASPDFQKQ
jgi:uncharacterized protein (DUF1800 family)